MEHRSIKYLNDFTKKFNDLNSNINLFLAGKGVDLPDWPKWCFLPMAAWYSIISAHYNSDRLSTDTITDVSKLAALGTWRYSQGIYRINDELRHELIKSQLNGNIPSNVLYRLPEWCMYIETPNLTWQGECLHGCWVHLEWDINAKRTELRFLLDCEHSSVPFPIHLGDWTIEDAVNKSIDESLKQAQIAGLPSLESNKNENETIVQEVTPLISFLLYLCSEEPEIDDDREPGTSPSLPIPKKTKRGATLFPAKKPRVWSVGTKIGEALKNDKEKTSNQTTGDRTVKTHLRRAHWHGFWTGARTSQRKFIYKWIPPIIVGQ